MRFHVQPRDVPVEAAARRLGMTRLAFDAAMPNLIARGFPRPDPDTGNLDLEAINRWCDSRHPHLFDPGTAGNGARNAADVVADRLAAMRASRHG